MILCLCQGVSEGTVRAAIGSGAETLDDIASTCTAGGDCGACHEMLLDLLADARPCRRSAREPAGASA
jgi:bacterioferritin-associated ferredoxin